MTITKIAPAVKTEGRYNVFVDDKFAFSLSETQLIEAGLKKGQVVSEDEVARLKSESDFGKNYIRAVDLISRRLRSEKEIRDYAWRKQWTPENRDRVIERLTERGYLNDEKFAESFTHSRATTKNLSRRKMAQELMKKGLEKDLIEKTLQNSAEYDEKQALQNLVAKKRDKYDSEQKLTAYLVRQGFSYDDVKNALSEDQNQ
ncbi:MAG: RecX family transcriptional regulator [Candidatus Nomurabacteria bacterium]|nr:RecX family transcriptional regulator [Candidatus Nomurabacteria bacterium]